MQEKQEECEKTSFLISISYLCRHNILILLTYDQETTSITISGNDDDSCMGTGFRR